MNIRKIACGMIAGILVLAPAVSSRAEESAFRIGADIGLVLSPTFHSYMGGDDAAKGWLGLGISGKVRITENWAVVPAIRLYGNGSGNDHYNDDGEIFTHKLQVLTVPARYSNKQGSTLFMQAGPNFTLAQSTYDDVDMKGGGLGAEASVGYAFRLVELELGYKYLPVKAKKDWWRGETTENFGGPYFCVNFRL